MGDSVHFKVTFEVREQYNMTQEMAAYAWTKFSEFKTEGPKTYRVEGSRVLAGGQSGPSHTRAAELAAGVLVYVSHCFQQIEFDILEFWIKVEKDE